MSRSENAVTQNLDIDASGESPDPRAMLLAELADFVTRHRVCRQLTLNHRARARRLPAQRRLFLRRHVPAVGDAGRSGERTGPIGATDDQGLTTDLYFN
jgi:hypothetical protein